MIKFLVRREPVGSGPGFLYYGVFRCMSCGIDAYRITEGAEAKELLVEIECQNWHCETFDKHRGVEPD